MPGHAISHRCAIAECLSQPPGKTCPRPAARPGRAGRRGSRRGPPALPRPASLRLPDTQGRSPGPCARRNDAEGWVPLVWRNEPNVRLARPGILPPLLWRRPGEPRCCIAGAAILLVMWSVHYLLFRTASWPAWVGTVIVVENVVSSLVHSHLFDFMHGWLYVYGVGVIRRES